MVAHTCRDACELKNKVLRLARRARSGQVLRLAFVLLLIGTASACAQEPQVPSPPGEVQQPVAAETAREAHETGQAEEEHAEEEHSVWAGLLWPTVNFAILFGGLWYLLKSPLAGYMRDRHDAIRKDLVEAAHVKAAAAAQLAEIDRKLAALPGEIDALRHRGAEEIAAEESRIAALAAAERERLLEQTRREIDLQLRLAKRELVEHAANLSVALATDRIQKQITAADQARIVDRYVDNVSGRADHPRQGDGGPPQR